MASNADSIAQYFCSNFFIPEVQKLPVNSGFMSVIIFNLWKNSVTRIMIIYSQIYPDTKHSHQKALIKQTKCTKMTVDRAKMVIPY